MKIRTFADKLTDAVAFTARALPSRPPVPVLLGMLLTTSDNGLRLAASDTEVYTTATVAAEIANDGQVLVPGRLLADICARLPKAAEVDLELDADGTRLRLVCGSARFSLPTLPIDEYPALPALPDSVATVQADTFAAAVAQVAVAASTDTALPAMTGVQLRLAGDQLILAATDRYRIGRRELTVRPTGTQPPTTTGKKRRKPDPGEGADPAATTPSALVPAKALAEAAKALEGEHTLTLHWSEGLVGLSIPGGRSYTTRILSGYEFPKTDNLIGSDWTATWTLPVGDAVAAVQRVALVATRNTPVRLVLATTSTGTTELRIEAGSGDDAHALDRIPVNTEGDSSDGFTIAFNPGYLTDALKALDAPEAEIRILHQHKPALVLPRVGQSSTSEDYQHLLMPVRLNG